MYVRHSYIFKCFNPRTHIGCDTTSTSSSPRLPSFNPRTHIGCDSYSAGFTWRLSGFQSTHPHRVRPQIPVAIAGENSFNPRTHIGCDSLIPNKCTRHKSFQSTHPHRVRLKSSTVKIKKSRFQSTHPHRVRLNSMLSLCWHTSFNPRTHIGCDWRR